MENIFSEKHLMALMFSSFLILILLIISLVFLKKVHRIKILKISSLILIGLELTKFLYIFKESGSLSEIFIPMHFCSIGLYLFPYIAFSNSKFKEKLKPFAYVGVLAGALLAIFIPTNILGDVNIDFFAKENFLYLLSFIFHAFLIYMALYLRLSKEYVKKKNDYLNAILVTIVFAIMAMMLNGYLETDFMMLRLGAGNPLQFIIEQYGYI